MQFLASEECGLRYRHPVGFCDCRPGKRRRPVHRNACSLRASWQNVEGALRATPERIRLADPERHEEAIREWLHPATLESLPRVSSANKEFS